MSVNNQLIKIEPSILIWARESLGLSVAEVGEKMEKDTETIEQWEAGSGLPSLAQLEKLAYTIYKRPLAVFFLPQPPAETSPAQDFRTLSSKETSHLSPELRLIIRKAKYHQLALKEINEDRNPAEKPLHKQFRLKPADSAAKIAQAVRKFLGITKALQEGWKNAEHAFRFYRNAAEQNGISVFQYPLPHARGFSLMDKEFPVIVLNSGDTFNSKIFTLFHELCHILFNTGGIFRDTNSGDLIQETNGIEIFCNQFASDVILPAQLLLQESLVKEHTEMEWPDEILKQIADHYKVSKEVVLRKLLEEGKTTKAFYARARNRWLKSYEKEKQEKPKQDGGPSFHTTNLSHLGKNFVKQVLNGFHAGKLSETQVADFLNIKINRIREYELKTS